MELQQFQQHILKGIPSVLPQPKTYESTINHAPKRKDILNGEEKKLAIQNALRYFEPQHHAVLAKEFAEELKKYGREYIMVIVGGVIPAQDYQYLFYAVAVAVFGPGTKISLIKFQKANKEYLMIAPRLFKKN